MALTDKLTAIAEGFRSSRGTTEKLSLDDMAVLAAENVAPPTQEKTVDITENGTAEITADEGYLLSKVTANVNVASSGGGGENKLAQVVAKTITEIKKEDIEGGIAIPQYLFQDCKDLVSVALPNTITSIEKYAFENCSNLIDISLNEGLEKIDVGALRDCKNITSIKLPSTLKSLGSQAFAHVYLETLEIPDLVTTLPSQLFDSNSKLHTVKIGSGITSIDSFAFYNCNNIGNVYVKDLSQYLRINLGARIVGSTAAGGGKLYVNGTLLQKFILPEEITALKSHCLSRFNTITEVVLHNNLITIGYGVFNEMKGLTNIEIPDSVTTIDNSVFYMTSLKTIVLGSGITSIGTYMIRYSDKLELIKIRATTPPAIQSTTLTGIPSACRIEVPAESVEAYKAATNWSAYADKIFAIEE